MSFNGFIYKDLKPIALDNKCILGEQIVAHTSKKIEYVARYVDEWLYVIENISGHIFFIDAMSNAGLYENNFLSTALEVLNVFIRHAQRHQDRNYYLFCNDYDKKKIKTLTTLKNYMLPMLRAKGIHNIYMYVDCADASEYIRGLNLKLIPFRGAKSSTLLYVDPYNILTEELGRAILDFSNKVYSEVLINFFSSDIVRNINNQAAVNKSEEIHRFIKGFCEIEDDTSDENEIRKAFIGKMLSSKYLSYYHDFIMKNSTNITLYHLIYFTPNLRGLEKIKDTTYKLFKTYRDYDPKRSLEYYTIDLFGKSPEDYACDEAMEIILKHARLSRTIEYSFKEIEEILLQEGVIPVSLIINGVLRPLIKSGKVEKRNLKGPRNFKEDNYLFKAEAL